MVGRMLRITICLLPLLATVGFVDHGAGVTDPPLQLTVSIGGHEQRLVEGVEAVVVIDGKQTKVKVVVEPMRRFQAAGVEFDFPRDMAFEHDAEDFDSWTLDGSDVIVHVHRHEAGKAIDLTRGTLAGMLATLDGDSDAPVRHEVTLGGTKYTGFRGRATFGPATIEVIAVGIDIGKRPLVLMLQHTLADDGTESAEKKRVLEMIEKTLKVTGK